MGGPGSVEFKNLISWPESENLGIKYYSGTASYQNTFIIKDEIEGAKVFLDLGELYNVAEIVLGNLLAEAISKGDFGICKTGKK